MAKHPFGFDKPEESLGFLLWQTTMIWQRQIKKALEKHDISHAQFVILATVLWFEAHETNITQIQIVNWTKLDKMTVSKSLKKLVAQGLVNRMEHESDTRAKSVTLTMKGKNLITQLIPIVEKADATFFGNVFEREQRSLINVLRKLNEKTAN